MQVFHVRNSTIYMIDHTDLIILKMLEKNGRVSFASIGKKCGMTGTGIGHRFSVLSKLGYIDRIEAVLSYKAKVEIDILLIEEKKEKEKKEELERLVSENGDGEDFDPERFGFSKVSD